MVRSSQDSSSTPVSRHDRFIRRVRNSENRRTREHLPSHVQRHIHQWGCPPRMSLQFTGTTNIRTAIPTRVPPANGSFVMHFHTHIYTHAARPLYLRTNVNPFADTGGGTGVRIPACSSPGNNPQPPLSFRDMPSTHVNEFTGVQTPVVGYHQQTQNNGGFTSGAQMNAVWPRSVTGGYNPGGPGASLTPGVQTPAVGLGLNNGGFPCGAQMNAVWPGAVTGGYNPREPGASLTPGVQTPAVGLGLNSGGFTSSVQMNAVWPGAVTGGYNPREPGASLTHGVQTPAVGLGQTAAPPEDFLLRADSDSLMHMLDQIFRV